MILDFNFIAMELGFQVIGRRFITIPDGSMIIRLGGQAREQPSETMKIDN